MSSENSGLVIDWNSGQAGINASPEDLRKHLDRIGRARQSQIENLAPAGTQQQLWPDEADAVLAALNEERNTAGLRHRSFSKRDK